MERITAFEHQFAKAQATTVVDLPFGFAVLQDDFPRSHTHNHIAVNSGHSESAQPPPSSADLLAAAEEVLGGAGRAHRHVLVGGDLGADVAADFVAAGYEHETIATMIFDGREIEPASHQVRSVSLATMRPAIIRDWRVDIPDADDDLLRQLADRMALYARGAELTLLAAYDGDEIAARVELYVDRARGVAQIESLMTHADFRGRGYADALVREGIRLSYQADCDVVFLTADLNDWPYGWYQRCGFVDTAHVHHFSRSE